MLPVLFLTEDIQKVNIRCLKNMFRDHRSHDSLMVWSLLFYLGVVWAGRVLCCSVGGGWYGGRHTDVFPM